jgi:hypothetical protein
MTFFPVEREEALDSQSGEMSGYAFLMVSSGISSLPREAVPGGAVGDLSIVGLKNCFGTGYF